MNRPPIPRQLEREVLMEAGYRCGIPACKQTPVEIHHIEPWEKVKEHTFDNLIALCANCHSRFHKGEIDRKAMVQFKANLSIVYNRYGDLEQRVLKLFASNPRADRISLPGNFMILLMYLLNDGFIVPLEVKTGVFIQGIPAQQDFLLTAKGREFINKWIDAKELE